MRTIIDELDYKTFIKIISNIPSCIFFKDIDLRYRFTTHVWEQLISDDIVGKTDLEIRKDKENAVFAMETDKNIIRTGRGCSYVIKSDIDGNVSYLELIKEPVFDENGEVIGLVGLINDVTEKTVLEQKLKDLTTYDTLTRVLNRHTGTEAITACIESNKKNKVFCLLDLNNFKTINDTYGHQVGDKVLQEFGLVLKRTLYDNDIAMRLGGDEFIVLLNDITDESQVKAFINKLYENLNSIKIKELENNITVSIGATFIKENSTFDNLYSITDKNMYIAKNNDIHFCFSK